MCIGYITFINIASILIYECEYEYEYEYVTYMCSENQMLF